MEEEEEEEEEGLFKADAVNEEDPRRLGCRDRSPARETRPRAFVSDLSHSDWMRTHAAPLLQKRPIYTAKETYLYSKRDLLSAY